VVEPRVRLLVDFLRENVGNLQELNSVCTLRSGGACTVLLMSAR